MTVSKASASASVLFDELRARSQADFKAKIPAHLERLGWNGPTLGGYQRTALQSLLSHARAHSPFHARRLQDIDLERFEVTDLASLPTMSKREMMASFDEVVTDRRLTRKVVEAQLASTGEQPGFLFDEYVCLASGGSSGQRGLFVWQWQACSDYLLAVVRAALARVMSAGGPPPGGLPTAIVAAGSAIHATRALTSIYSGDVFRVSAVPATLPLPEITERLNHLQPALLIGYTAMLGALADEQVAGRLRIAPQTVIGTSEPFPPELKAQVGAAFSAPTVDSFGSSEGLIGTAPPAEEAFSLASDLAIVELVDDQNRPVAPGQASAKVLVTSLLNRAQPLIRYELTDRMVQQPPSPAHGHVRVTVEGRADDVFAYGDVRLHPFVVRSVLAAAPEVTDYRVRQTPRGVALEIVAAAAIDTAALERRIAAALTGAGLSEPTATVTILDRLERHADTGKLTRFIALGSIAQRG